MTIGQLVRQVKPFFFLLAFSCSIPSLASECVLMQV